MLSKYSRMVVWLVPTLVFVLAFVGGTVAAQTQILFSGWSGEEQASKPIINWMMESFNEANPDVKVTWLGWPWQQTSQQLVLRYRSNQAPDVAQLDANWLNTFARIDALVDLNEVFGRKYLESKMDQGLLALGQVGGRQFAVPWTAASIGMVANSVVLEKAGIKKLPTTIKEFETALEAIKKTQPEVIPYAISTKGHPMITPDFAAWLWTFGGRIFDEQGNVVVNSDEGVRALAWLKSLMDRGLIAKDMDRFDARTLFAQHKVGFYDDAIMARGIARANSGQGEAFDVNVLPIPRPTLNPGDKPQSVAWGHLLVLFKQPGKTIDRNSPSAKFLEHLVFNDTVSLRYFEDQGMLPVTKSALASSVVTSDKYSSIWAQFTTTSRRDETSRWKNPSALQNIIGEEVQAALLGFKTAKKALDDMAQRLSNATQAER